MILRPLFTAAVVGMAALAPLHSSSTAADTIFDAMEQEMKRSMQNLAMGTLQKPYYIEYKITESHAFDVKASFGALQSNESASYRTLSAGLRVGSPEFDNTNFFDIGLSFFGSSDDEESYRGRRIPVEADNAALRRELWLATDAAYKQAVELYAKKEAAVQNKVRRDTVPDFSLAGAASTVNDVEPIPEFPRQQLESLVVELSAIFRTYPSVMRSSVAVEFLPRTVYYRNSEGKKMVKTELFTGLEVVATAQAADGMPVAEYYTCYTSVPAQLPGKDSLRRAVENIARRLEAAVAAGTIEPYSGPVLFEDVAAGEVIAQAFAPYLVTQRSPVTERGTSGGERYTAFQNKVGGRVLPEFLSLSATPGMRTYGATPLVGSYRWDDEAIRADSLKIVDKGYLRTLMSSRVPTRRIRTSNGHQRGGAAMYSVLSLEADDKKKVLNRKALRKKLLDLCKARELPYGIVVRKVLNQNILYTTLFRLTDGEFPFSRNETSLSLIEVYKVYPDGREEPIRGVEAAGLSPQALKDIIAVGNQRLPYNILAGAVTSPYITGGAQFLGASVVVPDMLFEDLEIKPIEDDFMRPPLLSRPEMQPTPGSR